MTIWVDADACPAEIREVLYRAALRRRTPTVLVANTPQRTPESEYLSSALVPPGADAADHFIVLQCHPGDLVITADVPLAARIVAKGATGLNPRGELYTAENVGQCLSMRNFMEEMRGAGLVEGGPAGHRSTDTQRFANALDRFLAKQSRSK